MLRESIGISQRKLSFVSGMSPEYINRIESEKITNVGIEKIEALAKALNVPISKILSNENEDITENRNGQDNQEMPIVGYANAGKRESRIQFDDSGYPVGWGHRIFPKPSDFKDPNGYVVLIKGDSMLPMKEGFKLVVSPNIEVKDGDDVVVRTADDDVYYKQVAIKGDTVVLKSYNSAFDPIILNRAEIKFMHKVWAIFIENG